MKSNTTTGGGGGEEYAGSGGGMSGVFENSVSQANSLVIAGGGGGCGRFGDASNITICKGGGDITSNLASGQNGGHGTTAAGGIGGNPHEIYAGSALQGGRTANAADGCGGGGGGYYGGGAGGYVSSYYAGSGGGGSSYAKPGVTVLQNIQGIGTDPRRPSLVGESSAAQTTGRPGAVIILWGALMDL